MSLAAVASALGAGLLSFFSPCVVPLLPVYIGMLAVNGEDGHAGLACRAVSALAFALGICCVFVALGFGAGALGALLDNAYVGIALGIVVMVLGLHLAGIIRIAALDGEKRPLMGAGSGAHGVAGSFVMGVAFSFGWTPCVGPVLGSILALAAEQGSALVGAGLLLAYALGLSVPFVAIALASGVALDYVRKLTRWLPTVQRVGGVVIALMGVWLVFSQVSGLVARQSALEAAERAQQSQTEAATGGSLVAKAQGASAGDASLDGISSAWKNVVLTDLDGNKHRLSELSGKPVYLEFWGSWCSSCVADLDQLGEVWQDHDREGDVTVVSVVAPGFYGERDADDFVAWARENNVRVPVYMDTNLSLVTYLNVAAFPTSVFIDSEGNLARIRVGAIERADLEDALSQLS